MWWQLELVLSMMRFLLWNILRKAFNICRSLSWWISGVENRRKTIHKNTDLPDSVQVLKILLRHKFDVLHELSGLHNFIACHQQFVDAEYVLKDNITLYYVTATEAIFVEANEDKDVANSDNGPFLRQAQFNHATKVLIMPMHVFLRLGQKVGRPRAKLVLIPNVGRCGTTMVTQVFEAHEGVMALSEPDSLNAMTQLKGIFPAGEFKEILQCCMNFTCKHMQTKHIVAYVIKPGETTINLLPDIIELFPEAKCLFGYRHPLATSRSISRICYTAPLLQLMMFFGQISPKMTKLSIDLMSMPADAFEERILSRLHIGAIVWASVVRKYLDYRNSGMGIVAIRYEDIIEDRSYAFQQMFRFCGLPYDEQAVEKAMSRDSERGTVIGREATQKFRQNVDHYTEDVKKQTDKVCDQYGVPRFDDFKILPGTITTKTEM